MSRSVEGQTFQLDKETEVGRAKRIETREEDQDASILFAATFSEKFICTVRTDNGADPNMMNSETVQKLIDNGVDVDL